MLWGPEVIEPVSYSMLNGDTGTYAYHDDSYSGLGDRSLDRAALSGGTGQLTDGVVGVDACLADLGRGPAHEWVAWKDADPVITLDMGAVRRIGGLRVHANNGDSIATDVCLFTSASVEYSVDGVLWGDARTRATSTADLADRSARFVDVDVAGEGRFVRLTLTRGANWVGNPWVWVFVSEVQVVAAAPTVTIASSLATLRSGQTSKISFTLSDASTNFSLADVNVTGGTLSAFVGSGAAYSATFRPQAGYTGPGTVSVAAGAFTDSRGIGNDAGDLAPPIAVDTVAPSVAIASDKARLRAGETATLTFTLSEPSANFVAADVTVAGGALSAFAGAGSVYTATFTPSASSTRNGTAAVTAGRFTDTAGNPNVAGAMAPAIVIDTLRPTLRITSDKSALKAGETATITFTASEPIVIDPATVVVGGGTLTGFSGAGAIYTATFTPNVSSIASGTVSVAAGRFTDLAGNVNAAAASLPAIKIDTRLPTVRVTSSPSSLRIGATSRLTFALSEASTTFGADDVGVTGGTLSSFAGAGTAYSATFTPTLGFEGAGTVGIAAGAFLDAAGNGNVAGGLAVPIRIDTLAPTVRITSDLESLAAGQTTTVRFTLSEPSTTFKATSLSVSNGTVSNFVALSPTSYTATFAPTLGFQGTAVVSVPAGAFTDALGNASVAATPLAVAVAAGQWTASVTADRGTAVYAVGEAAGFTITLDADGLPAVGDVVVTLMRDKVTRLQRFTCTLVDGRVEIWFGLDRPGFLTCIVQGPAIASTTVGFEPERILPSVEEPGDFDAFWAAGLAEAAVIPPDAAVTPCATGTPSVEAFKISLANVDGTRVWAFLTKPKVVTSPLPLLVSVPGASFRSPARPGLDWVDRGVMRLWISVHPHDPQLSTAELDALEASPAGNYTRLGAPDPQRYYYRRAILGAVRMIDYVCANFPWDGAHCVAYGQSQGGAFSLFTAALSDRVTACVAEAPAMCDHGGVVIGRGIGWPQLVPGNDQADQAQWLAMCGYYEGAFFARRVTVPTLFTVGFVDDTCPPTSVYAAFNQVAGPKAIVDQVDRGHALGSPAYAAFRDGSWLPAALGLGAVAASGGSGWADGGDEELEGVEPGGPLREMSAPEAFAAAWATLVDSPAAAPAAALAAPPARCVSAAIESITVVGTLPGAAVATPVVVAAEMHRRLRWAVAWQEATLRRAAGRAVVVAGLGGALVPQCTVPWSEPAAGGPAADSSRHSRL